MPGSGILLPENEALNVIKRAHADGIWSHEGCGAAELSAKEQNLQAKEADLHGRRFAESLAAKAGIPYLGHTGLQELKRPAEFHDALVAYYDGTGRFDSSRVPGLPQGFVISRKYLNPSDAKRSAEISIAIALGNHGYGDLFDKSRPFTVIPIGSKTADSQNLSLETLRNELSEIKFKNKSKVVIDGFSF